MLLWEREFSEVDDRGIFDSDFFLVTVIFVLYSPGPSNRSWRRESRAEKSDETQRIPSSTTFENHPSEKPSKTLPPKYRLVLSNSSGATFYVVPEELVITALATASKKTAPIPPDP